MDNVFVTDSLDGKVDVLIPTDDFYPMAGCAIRRSAMPADKLFRDAWRLDSINARVEEDFIGSLEISHNLRRQSREIELEPLDKIYILNIPGTNIQSIEDQREEIRAKYRTIQTELDACTNTQHLREVLVSYGLIGEPFLNPLT